MRRLVAGGLWLAATAGMGQAQANTDWAGLNRYRAANETLSAPRAGQDRVVLFGDSITEEWVRLVPTLFGGTRYVGRGISGQTTPQMLVRFRQDVLALKPKAVVILAGTNDIAGNTGPSTLEMIEDNLVSMTELAKANNIKVVLASVLPVADYPWKRGLEPAPKVVQLNNWIKQYAETNGHVFLDYHTAMAGPMQSMRADLSRDGVHPNAAGYAVMQPLLEKAIATALPPKP
jgi:lysophospholipase L1-like esterase